MATIENNDDTDRGGTRTASPETSEPTARALVKNQSRSMALVRRLGSFGPFALMRHLFENRGRPTGVGMGHTRLDESSRLDGLIFSPLVEVAHRDGKLIVNVDLPGTAVDDIRVTVDDGALIIEGERRGEREEHDGHIWRRERVYGRFQRVIALPQRADPSTTEARFENGVLEISLRAPEPGRRGREIAIKTNGKSSEPSNEAGSR
jgi:HSP20 family protein